MFSNFGRLFFSLFTGIFSGLIALLALSVLQSLFIAFSAEELISKFFINEVGEEVIKLLSIIFILNLLIADKRDRVRGLFCAVSVGVGFGIFELILIILSNKTFSISSILMLIGIHSLTSLFLGMAVVSRKFEKSWFFLAFFVIIATLIHIVYNLLALNF